MEVLFGYIEVGDLVVVDGLDIHEEVDGLEVGVPLKGAAFDFFVVENFDVVDNLVAHVFNIEFLLF